MLGRPPRERRAVSWLLFAGWAVVIYLTVPLARTIQGFVSETFGRQLFGQAVLAVVAVGLAALLWKLWRERSRLRRSFAGGLGRLGWILLIAAIYVHQVLSLWKAPEEAMHFVQYGVLGVLAFRALSHDMRDLLIYLAAALACTLVGTFDEVIQWFTPKRYFDFRDVGLNALGASLALAAVGLGLRPPHVEHRPGPRSARRVLLLAAAEVAVILLCLTNTPALVERYAGLAPFLERLRTNPSTMAEYGHLHEPSEKLSFYSRMTLEELEAEDRRRAEEAGRILREADRDAYSEFLSVYTSGADPFLHELRVHLFRRDRYLETARELEAGTHPNSSWEDPGPVYAVAWWENRIVERFFPKTFERSGYAFAEDVRSELEAKADLSEPYVSAVSRHLITGWTRAQVWAAGLALLAVLVAGAVFAGRRARTEESAPGSPSESAPGPPSGGADEGMRPDSSNADSSGEGAPRPPEVGPPGPPER